MRPPTHTPSLFGDEFEPKDPRPCLQSTTRSKQEKREDYEAFIEKFTSKKTTDDCYTPPEIHETVLRWARENCHIPEGARIVRPFFPGGDYEAFDYETGDVVVDNPPFSIISKIVVFYCRKRIPFFLFAPSLTLFSGYRENLGETYIIPDANIEYENGAIVRTGFITNIWPTDSVVVVAGSLGEKIKVAAKQREKEQKKLPVYEFPSNLISAARLGKIAARGIDWEVPRKEAEFLRALDSKRARGKALFGGGFLISERLTAERLAAERLAAERSAEKIVWTLSEREKEIIKRLSAESPEDTNC